MKIKTISYHKLVNTNNFSNIKFGAEAEVQPGDDVMDVSRNLRKFVHDQLDILQISSSDLSRAQRIVDNPRDYKIGEVEDAKLLLEKYNSDDLPF